jgi:type IV secretory pathway TrbL component
MDHPAIAELTAKLEHWGDSNDAGICQTWKFLPMGFLRLHVDIAQTNLLFGSHFSYVLRTFLWWEIIDGNLMGNSLTMNFLKVGIFGFSKTLLNCVLYWI